MVSFAQQMLLAVIGMGHEVAILMHHTFLYEWMAYSWSTRSLRADTLEWQREREREREREQRKKNQTLQLEKNGKPNSYQKFMEY